MLNYFKKGWRGELSFSQVLLGKGGDYFLLDGGLAYIGFYVLLLIFLSRNFLSLSNGIALIFCAYGVALYVWMLKAFWGSANHCKGRVNAMLVRIFTILLPVLSLILLVAVCIYNILIAIMDAFS